jgi:murein DD-endopeptidase MepM/ murein hydrolase activator NlpD
MRPLLAFLSAVLLAGCSDDPSGPALEQAAGLVAPLEVPARTSNVFDHDLPFPFVVGDGYQLSWWGEHVVGIGGHAGYDFVVPEGTPVRASGPGVVRDAGDEPPFDCPLLGRVVSGRRVIVRHALDAGRFETRYLHLSRIDVARGQTVEAGDVIGLSGNTGCSTGPHLHFQVHRSLPDGSAGAVVDPYGWEANLEDPWSRDPRGATSSALWLTGEAPPLYAELAAAVPTLASAGIVRVRWMGVRDATNPVNEFVDIAKAASATQVDLGGWTLRTNGTGPWTIPAGTVLDAARPVVRVHVGPPSDPASVGLGLPGGIIDNRGDCLQLAAPDGTKYTLLIRTQVCTLSPTGLRAATIVTSLPEPGDAARPEAPPER